MALRTTSTVIGWASFLFMPSTPSSTRHPEVRPRPLEPGEPSQVGLGRLAHLMIRSRVNPRSVGDGPGRSSFEARACRCKLLGASCDARAPQDDGARPR